MQRRVKYHRRSLQPNALEAEHRCRSNRPRVPDIADRKTHSRIVGDLLETSNRGDLTEPMRPPRKKGELISDSSMPFKAVVYQTRTCECCLDAWFERIDHDRKAITHRWCRPALAWRVREKEIQVLMMSTSPDWDGNHWEVPKNGIADYPKDGTMHQIKDGRLNKKSYVVLTPTKGIKTDVINHCLLRLTCSLTEDAALELEQAMGDFIDRSDKGHADA